LFDSNFDLNKDMARLLPELSKKYRVYLITQLPVNSTPELSKAKKLLEVLINKD
jgi:hypothetical protein